MRRWLVGNQDFTLWILLPLVVAPFVLGTAVSVFRPSLVPTANGVHVLLFWIPVVAAAAAVVLLVATGHRPASPWVANIYLGLTGLVAGSYLEGALPGSVPAELGQAAPLLLAVALPLLWTALRRRVASAAQVRLRDPVVVCVAGMREPAEVWHGLTPLLRRLGPVKALALPGFGLTPRPRHPLDIAGQLGWLEAELGDRPALLVGHSYGAHLALRYALLRPERVRALILIAPALLRVGETPPRPARLPVPWLERSLLDLPAQPPGVPVCLVYGELDPLVPAVWAPEVARCLGAELHVVPGMGHLFTPSLGRLRGILLPFLERLMPAGAGDASPDPVSGRLGGS